MKKIFLFIMLLFMFTGVESYAHSYTTDENQSNDYEYINEEVLSEGKLIKTDLNLIAPAENYYINNITIEKDIYIVVGYVITGQKGDNYDGYPFVSYYENYALRFSKIFDANGNGEFKNAILIDKYIYLSGNIEDKGVLKPYLVKLDIHGSVYKTEKFECDKNTTVSCMFNDFNELYLVGVTQATTIKNHTFSNLYNRVFFIKLDYSFNIIMLELIANEKNNKIYSVIYNEYNFYVYGETGGSGDIEVNDDYQKVVYSFDIFGAFIYSSKVNSIVSGFCDIVEFNRNIYFLNKPYNANYVDIYSGDYQVINKLSRIIVGKGNEQVKNVFYKKDKDVLLVGQVISDGEEDILRLDYIKDKIEATVSINLHEICSVKNIIFNNGRISFFGNKLKNNIYNPFAAEVVLLKKIGEKFYVNNIEMIEEIPTLETNKFGYYTVDVKYSFNDIDIYSKKSIYHPLQTNIANREVYDVGVPIYANGDIYINGKTIKNGDLITKEGEYIIEIKGNGVDELYYIKVDRIQKEVLEKESSALQVEYLENVNTNADEITISANAQAKKYSSKQLLINVCLSMGAMGIIFGLIMPIKKKVKKNV